MYIHIFTHLANLHSTQILCTCTCLHIFTHLANLHSTQILCTCTCLHTHGASMYIRTSVCAVQLIIIFESFIKHCLH